MMQPAIFLDRDGVIIEEVGYLSRPEQIKLEATSAEAIRRVNKAGVPIIVVTNQAGIARGFISEIELVEIHQQLDQMLAKFDAHIDRYYYCPHHPSEGNYPYVMDCTCRKPKPGMLKQAANELNLLLSDSFMVGDKICDIQAGINAGCHPILVESGYGNLTAGNIRNQDEFSHLTIVKNVLEAVTYSLSKLKR